MNSSHGQSCSYLLRRWMLIDWRSWSDDQHQSILSFLNGYFRVMLPHREDNSVIKLAYAVMPTDTFAHQKETFYWRVKCNPASETLPGKDLCWVTNVGKPQQSGYRQVPIGYLRGMPCITREWRGGLQSMIPKVLTRRPLPTGSFPRI